MVDPSNKGSSKRDDIEHLAAMLSATLTIVIMANAIEGYFDAVLRYFAQRLPEWLAYAPARKDVNEGFPFRGFVLCDDCGEPMTSCWSKGRNKHYPYYL